MLAVTMLKRHPSSSISTIGDREELAKRQDLYVEKNFYFGFSSSNQTFFDIVTEKSPLAVKYGPILFVYRQDDKEFGFQTYYIDFENKQLSPILRVRGSQKESTAIETLLPLDFSDGDDLGDLMKRLSENQKEQDERALDFKGVVSLTLEKFATLKCDAIDLDHFVKAVQVLSLTESDILFELGDIEKLKLNLVGHEAIAQLPNLK